MLGSTTPPVRFLPLPIPCWSSLCISTTTQRLRLYISMAYRLQSIFLALGLYICHSTLTSEYPQWRNFGLKLSDQTRISHKSCSGCSAHLRILEGRKEDVYLLEHDWCHRVSLCGGYPLLVAVSNRRRLKQTRNVVT